MLTRISTYWFHFDIRRVSELEGVETVTKILNGGGGLSEELVEGASRLFPRATILSAYGVVEIPLLSMFI